MCSSTDKVVRLATHSYYEHYDTWHVCCVCVQKFTSIKDKYKIVVIVYHICVLSGLPQWGKRFLADSNSWNVNGKLDKCEADRCSSVLNKRASDNVLMQHSVYFWQLRLLGTKLNVKRFLFLSLWQHGSGKYNKTTATEYLLRENLWYTIFSAKFREVRAKYPLHLQTFLATTPMCTPKVKQISKPYLSHLGKGVSNIKIKITILQIMHLSIT